MRLYELTEQYQALLDAASGEEPGVFDAALAQLDGELKEKVIALAKVILSLEVEGETYNTELKRLGDHARVLLNRATVLKDYVKHNLIAAEITHVKGDIVDVRIQEAPPAVEVIDEAHLGSEWKKATLKLPLAQVPEELLGQATVEIDRRSILDWVKSGNTAPEGTVITRGKFLRIR